MSRRVQIVQPPRIAAWLVGLFIVEEQTGTQEQNLKAAFSDSASRWGTGRAGHRYWSQCLKIIAGLVGRGFRTAPWLIVGTALGGALLLEVTTSNLQRVIMEFIDLLNDHVTPFYDSKSAANHIAWMYNAVFVGSLLESLLVGCFVALLSKRREMIAAIALSLVSLVMTATIFWESVVAHDPVDPALFPRIMLHQLGGSFLIVLGGIIVREMRSAGTPRLSRV